MWYEVNPNQINMKLNSFTLAFIVSILVGLNSYSQNDTIQESENPIDDEFTELMETSNNYQNYKVVERQKLNALQQSTATYISGLKEEIAALEESLQEQQENIDNQNTELQNVQAELEQVTAEKDAITFLGMPIEKNAYQTIMWGIVGVLALVLIFFIYRYSKSNADTKEAKKRQEETEKEFELYRAKALEKEQRMGRMLQDERNKHSNS